ncbi:MAG: tetratricopeptide repeat protein [Methanothrix sp.]
MKETLKHDEEWRPKEEEMLEPNARQYWLWVTRPDYYLDEDGNDREDLDPNSGVASDGWWTCNKGTKEGDLVLLWRTSPKKDIGYMIQAESDAYSIVDDNEHGWDYGCDYEVLYKFEHPIHVKDLRTNPYFEEWGPLRCSFQRRNFKISSEYWNKLNQLLASNNPGYQEFIENLQKEPLAKSIELEKELEDALATDLKVLKKFGYDLELYIDNTTNQSGRQLICKGNGGRIDLLCHDKTLKRYTVIELKNVRAGQNTFGQISNYMGWVQDRIAKGNPVCGLVISRGYDTRFESALKITDKISQINVEDLGFSIAPSKIAQEFNDIKERDISKVEDKSRLGTRSAKSREASAWLKKGNTFFDQEKYDEAVSCYDKIIEIDPKIKLGWINKGVTLAELMKHEEAISCYDKIILIHPRSADAWCNKAFALNGLNKFEDAIAAFDKAIEIKPKYSDAWNGKGIVMVNIEKYDEAIQAYNNAIKIRPKFAWAWNNKGWALANLNRYDEAVQAYDEAVRLDPKFIDAWNNKGDALFHLDQYDGAIKAYDKMIELDPKDATAWNKKGSALATQGNYIGSIKVYDKAIELDPKFAWPWFNKGYALYELGNYDEAIKSYDNAIKLDPEELSMIWSYKGAALHKLGEYDEAIKAYDRSIELDQKFAWPWNKKGIALYDQGNYADAIKYYDEAIRLDPNCADAWNNKGNALNALGRTTEANDIFAKAKEL